MTLTRWLTLIGIVVGLGCLQVAQRNAVVLKGYAVGERLHRIQQTETEVLLAKERVIGLASPAALAQAAEDRQMKFVAWATLPSAPENLRAVAAATSAAKGGPKAAAAASPLVRLAADGDTTD